MGDGLFRISTGKIMIIGDVLMFMIAAVEEKVVVIKEYSKRIDIYMRA